MRHAQRSPSQTDFTSIIVLMLHVLHVLHGVERE
ncbi:MAG: hypothetical protein N838_17110 [Thiohalocapsa sp. PB-PSB1]|nr:MAG: hypothetical protein N838_17110 [Thiohalocapsa sp. PB-PSB1]